MRMRPLLPVLQIQEVRSLYTPVHYARSSMSTCYVRRWKSVQACKLVAEKGITPENLICRQCRDDVRRMVGNPDRVPRWEKRKERVKCCTKDYTEVSYVFSNKVDMYYGTPKHFHLVVTGSRTGKSITLHQ